MTRVEGPSPTRAQTQIRTPADLQRIMRTDYQVSPQQWDVITAPLEPAVVIAGAGSGKTSVMAARVVYLVVTGQVRPDQVLGLTFTTKAATELRTRIRGALDAAGFGRGVVPPGGSGTGAEAEEEALEPVVATYHSYASALLTEHGLRIGHEPDTRVIADAARYQLAGRVIDRHRRPVRLLSDSPDHVIGYLLALDGTMAEHLVDIPVLREYDAREAPRFAEAMTTAKAADVASAFARREEVLDLVEEYRRHKQALGVMDFSDQIARAAELADRYPEVGALEREKYSIVLLDEYQDTSVAQATMLRRLFSGPTARAGRGHAVNAVGDPHQAIYGWRGASVSNIVRFGEDFPRADGDSDVASYPLTVNRRSDARILEVANELASPLYATASQVRPLDPGGDEVGRVQAIVHESYAGELAWLTEQVVAAHGRRRLARADDPRDHGQHWREIGVLVRDNAHAADVFDALTAHGVPVEIVGLKGLLRLPEISEVLSTLGLIHDLTANSDLLALLTGPRWAIGPRDLALLGRRAVSLAATRHPGRGREASLDEQLAEAVAGADPSELVALSDALEDPGELPYSVAARERFALLAAELRMLRTHAGEPLLELVRRIIDVCGIDVELASSVSEAARARRENLDLFVKAIAEFQAVDGQVTLPALLAWLDAEQDGEGLDIATPTTADSVKLLTVHRAKGLEWDTVFVVGVCEEKFPHQRIRGLWPTRPEFLPSPLRGDARDLPVLRGYDDQALAGFRLDTLAHEQTEELRLAYVAFTRARHELVVSSYLWKDDRKTPLGPSPYLQTLRGLLERWGEAPLAWLDKPQKGAANPLQAVVREVPWPVTTRTREAMLRLEAAERVEAALGAGDGVAVDADPDMVTAAQVAIWDEEIERLLVESRQESGPALAVRLPSSLSATSVARLRDDPAGFAGELARPMPRAPSPAARFGTRFHEWVESRFGQQDLIDPDDLPGRADVGIDDYADLVALIERFEQGPFADRAPHRLEAPFAIVLAGQVIRGRIDAVYAEPDGGYLIVDWKTGRAQSADPLQLAIYRLAWAELTGVPVERVRAGFYYVRTQDLVEPESLPGRAELEALILGAAQVGERGQRPTG